MQLVGILKEAKCNTEHYSKSVSLEHLEVLW